MFIIWIFCYPAKKVERVVSRHHHLDQETQMKYYYYYYYKGNRHFNKDLSLKCRSKFIDKHFSVF